MNKQFSKKKVLGASMIEYVLIVGLIAAGAVIALTALGVDIAGFFTSIASTITNSASNL